MSDLVVIPTGPTTDDLRPQIKLADEFQDAGINTSRIVFVLNNVATTPDGPEARDAFEGIQRAGFRAIKQAIPKRASYQHAQNAGRSISEAPHPSLKSIASAAVIEIYEIVEAVNV